MGRTIKLGVILLFAAALLLLPRPLQQLIASSCTTDSQCTSPYGSCDLTDSTCVSCVRNGDRAVQSADCCSDYLDPNKGYCANQSNTCTNCSSDSNCQAPGSGCSPDCDVTFGSCESYVPDGDAPAQPQDCCNSDYNSQSGTCGTGASCSTCQQGKDACYTCGETCDYPFPGGSGTCSGCVASGDYTQDQSNCCTGIGNYDNAWYQCE